MSEMNPLCVVEGGYAGIAMMAHSFTCMAIENNWPEVTTFKVRPLKKMAEIFINSLPKDKVTVNGIRRKSIALKNDFGTMNRL